MYIVQESSIKILKAVVLLLCCIECRAV